MKRSSRPRKTATLSKTLNRQLNAYALAAGASGVGLLALANPAAAKVIYTPAHTTIELLDKIPLDLNHDGKTDFLLRDSLFITSCIGVFSSMILAGFPAHKGNDIWGAADDASALAAGVRVGPGGRFSYGKKEMATAVLATSTLCYGAWNNVKKRYLGFKFTITGKTHFGWARLNVSCGNRQIRGLLTGYAYETIPNKAIITGKTRGAEDGSEDWVIQPATLGRLAFGSVR